MCLGLIQGESFMRRLISSILLIAVAGLPGVASADRFDSLFVFGDSLSDSGRSFAISGGTVPPLPPYAQRFSNGPVAVEYLAAHLGVTLLPSSVPGGTNFAVGGATTGTENLAFVPNLPPGVPALENTGMAVQVEEFLAAGLAFDPARALFVVWGGPNDLILASIVGEDLATTAGTAVANLAAAVEALALAGGRHFLVPNMVDLGKIPAFIGTPLEGDLRLLAQGFNAGLAEAMSTLEGGLEFLGVEVTIFDTFAAFDQTLTNPAAGGFTNTTSACIDDPVALFSDCPGYIFFDPEHPTTAAHHLLGQLFSAAVPGPSALALLLTAAAGVWAVGCRRKGGP
jgi:phospholipase/lecithinase/hemolysin